MANGIRTGDPREFNKGRNIFEYFSNSFLHELKLLFQIVNSSHDDYKKTFYQKFS